jgi:hypothetical protein
MRVTHWPILFNTIAAPTQKNVANSENPPLVLHLDKSNEKVLLFEVSFRLPNKFTAKIKYFIFS